jgi:hypothetical protein
MESVFHRNEVLRIITKMPRLLSTEFCMILHEQKEISSIKNHTEGLANSLYENPE